MTDLLSLARRLLEYADESGLPEQKREDFKSAADIARTLNTMLNAKPPSGNGEIHQFPDDRE